MDDKQRELMSKGFLKALHGFGDLQANEAKLKTAVLANEFEKKQNFFYKIQEQQQKNQMTEDLVKKMRSQEPGGMEGADFGPQVRAGEGGEAKVYYPSARDKEFALKQGWARIKAKQGRGMALNPAETKFAEKYPENMLRGGDKEIGQDKIINLAIKLAQSEGGGFASQDDIKKQIPVAQQMLMGTDFSGMGDKTVVSPKENAGQYTPDQEQLIQDNIKAYGRSREEVIQALASRNLL